MTTQSLSRTSRRVGTKSARRRACQQASAGVLRRARRAYSGQVGTGKRHSSEGDSPVLTRWHVRNPHTKREVQFLLNSSAVEFDAKMFAMDEYKLAKTPNNLVATAVS